MAKDSNQPPTVAAIAAPVLEAAVEMLRKRQVEKTIIKAIEKRKDFKKQDEPTQRKILMGVKFLCRLSAPRSR
jgi:hypothetical protein